MAAHVITICNHKGGVSKTCSTINLAHALEILGKSVLVVDCDPQANATQTLAPGCLENPPPGVAGLFNSKDSVFTNSFVDTSVPGVKIIPASPAMFSLEGQLPPTKKVLGLRAKLDDDARQGFDYIILDTPPSMGMFQITALVASDRFIVPVQSDSVYSLMGLDVLFKSIEIITEDANPELEMLGILRTLYDARTTVAKVISEKIEATFKGQVFQTIINRNAALTYSAVQQQTIYQFDGRSTGAKDYMALAKELLGIFGDES